MNAIPPARAARIKALLTEVRKAKAQGLLVTEMNNVRWLSGFSGSDATLFIGAGKPALFTDSRYTTQAAAEAPGFEVARTVDKFHDIIEFLGKRVRVLAFEREGMTHGRFLVLQKEAGKLRLVPFGEEIKKHRAVKDAEEVKLIRRAGGIAKRAFDEVARGVRPGMRERELALRLEAAMRALGSEREPFPTIVASGPRGALPHGIATARKMKKGDLVTVDFGALYRGYQSDQTITFCLGQASARQRKIYETVRQAHDRAIEAIKPGRTCKEVDAVARDYIREKGFGDYFGHGLGHGVGLETHELPTLNPRSADKLLPGMVVTVEPGIYVPGFGGVRIEDMVLVTGRGPRLLSSSGGKLREL